MWLRKSKLVSKVFEANLLIGDAKDLTYGGDKITVKETSKAIEYLKKAISNLEEYIKENIEAMDEEGSRNAYERYGIGKEEREKGE